MPEQRRPADHEHRDEQERATAASLPGARLHPRHPRTACGRIRVVVAARRYTRSMRRSRSVRVLGALLAAALARRGQRGARAAHRRTRARRRDDRVRERPRQVRPGGDLLARARRARRATSRAASPATTASRWRPPAIGSRSGAAARAPTGSTSRAPTASHAAPRARGAAACSRTPGSGGALVFSADGSRASTRTSYGAVRGGFVVDTRRATARRACRRAPASRGRRPTGRSSPAGVNGKTIVSDLAAAASASRSRASAASGRAAAGSRAQPAIDERAGTGLRRRRRRVRARRAPASPALPLGVVARRSLARAPARPARSGSPVPAISRALRVLLADWPGGAPSRSRPTAASSRRTSGGSPRARPARGRAAGCPGSTGGTGAWSRDGRLAYVDYARGVRERAAPGRRRSPSS